MFCVIFIVLLMACQEANGPSSQKKGEYISRKADEKTEIPPMIYQEAPKYFWENKQKEGFREITKEYFRCKGNSLNPSKGEVVRGEVVKYHDCGGASAHSLPLKDGKEFIYPVLLDLLNYIQNEACKRVIITSGHRCPAHNTYVDPSPHNQYSKHQIGAEVNFYVQGQEDQPERIIDLLFAYYKKHPQYGDKKEYTEFKRYEKDDVHLMIKPWMNKEIFIKLFKPSEGRNNDNRHPYPYISIQVRHDRDKNERVVYSWEQAFKNFLRY